MTRIKTQMRHNYNQRGSENELGDSENILHNIVYC